MKTLILCSHCGNSFEAENKYINYSKKKGWNLYCSENCKFAGKKKSEVCNCHTCGKSVIKARSSKKRSISGKVFCSRKCSTIFTNSEYKTGERHPNYNNGLSSYRQRKLRSGNNKCEDCGNSDIRVLEVHHRDENRKNNSLENLAILCANCHRIRHFENVV